MLRLILSPLAIGALVAFVALLSVDVILPWDDYVNVIDGTREQISQLSRDEVNDHLLKGTLALVAVNGAKKVWYILSHDPLYFAWS
jgi:uncharacterized protein (UPF0297 family)